MSRSKFILLLALTVLTLAGVGVFIWDGAGALANEDGATERLGRDEVMLLVMWTVATAAILLAAYRICRVMSVQYGGRLKERFDTLSQLIAAAEFSPNNGVLYLDTRRRILSASPMLLKIAGLSSDEMVGKSIEQAYSSKLARLLYELQDKATITKRAAAAEISDWLPYSPLSLGPVRVIATPCIDGDEILGFIFLFRSIAELRLTEESAQLHQQHYQVLLDTLNIGVGVFRPAVSPVDGGPDAYLIEANSALKKTFEGVSLPFNEPCSVVWPSFTSQPSLREGMGAVAAGSASYRCEFFSSVLCKHLVVNLASLPGNRILATFSDQTEHRLNENQVLQLNDQLQRTLGKQSAHLAFLMQDIEQVNAATADQVESVMEQAAPLIEALPQKEQAQAGALVQHLQHTLSQTLSYYEAGSLPYKENYLVYTAEIYKRVQEELGTRHPGIRFVAGRLPALVAAPKVMEQVMQRLLTRIARMPVTENPRIEVGEHNDFLNAGLYVAAWGFDTEDLFVEVPIMATNLDWGLSSDLELAIVRRMVVEHGGQLSLVATEDHRGFRVFFTIGTPA